MLTVSKDFGVGRDDNSFSPLPKLPMKKYLILTILGILLIPLSSTIPWRGDLLWYKQYLAMVFFFFLAMSVFMWDFNKYLSIFLGICLFSSFFVAMSSPRAMLLLWHLNLGAMAAYGISRFNSKYRRYILLYGILPIVVIQILWVTIQCWNIDPVFSSLHDISKDEIVGLCASKDQLGSFFAVTFPVMLHIFPPLGLLSVTGIILSKSSFAFISAILSGLLYLSFTNRTMFNACVVVSVIAGVLFFTMSERLKVADFTTRFGVWKHAVTATVKGRIEIEKNGIRTEVSTNPILGYGFGNWLRIFPYVPRQADFNYSNEKFTHAHNDYVEAFFELGYLGMASLTALIMNFIYRFIKYRFMFRENSRELVLCACCLFAYLLNASGNFISQIAVVGMFLILFFGMFEGRVRELKEIQNEVYIG